MVIKVKNTDLFGKLYEYGDVHVMPNIAKDDEFLFPLSLFNLMTHYSRINRP